MLPVPPRAGVQPGVHEEAVQDPQESVREAHEKAVHHESRVEFVRSGGARLRGGSQAAEGRLLPGRGEWQAHDA